VVIPITVMSRRLQCRRRCSAEHYRQPAARQARTIAAGTNASTLPPDRRWRSLGVTGGVRTGGWRAGAVRINLAEQAATWPATRAPAFDRDGKRTPTRWQPQITLAGVVASPVGAISMRRGGISGCGRSRSTSNTAIHPVVLR